MPVDRTLEIDISAIGGHGEGIAETPGGRLYVPYTVPGDRLRVRLKDGQSAETVRLVDGPTRIAPACRHFEKCGGCALQHVRGDAYVAWKRKRVVDALARRRLETDVAPLLCVPAGTRRRVRLGARATKSGVVLGFKERRRHRLVNIDACPVAMPEITAILPMLRSVLQSSLPQGAQAEISVTKVDAGLDIDVETDKEPELVARENLAAFAEANGLARITWGGSPLAHRRPVRVWFEGIEVDLPPRAFLQPTSLGETTLRDAVVTALTDAKTVADLYAGCGNFAFALAVSGKRVSAFEGVASQSTAIERAAARAALSASVAAETRDLERRPLVAPDLTRFDGIVLDPPRAGAEVQVRTIAASAIGVIAYASCNPVSFARDAQMLVDGGYRLERVIPIDQFLWSPHVELIGVFRR